MSQADTKPSLPSSSSSAAQTYPFPVEPSEELLIDHNKGNKNIWAVRIPRFLLERWERVNEAGIELGTLVVDNSVNPPKLSLRLPDTSSSDDNDNLIDLQIAAKQEQLASFQPWVKNGRGIPSAGPSRNKRKFGSYDTSNIPNEYEMYVPEERAKNTFVFSERVRSFGGMDGGKGRREKAYPKLLAAVAHEVTVKPLQNEKYKKILAQRRLESEQTRRPIIKMEQLELTPAQLNQLQSGRGNSTARFTLGQPVISKQAPDRQTRMDLNQLRNRLFQKFSEKPYWGIPALNSELKQPDTYLRETLKEIAEQVKEGRYMNLWTLKGSYRMGGGGATGGAKKEEGDDDDEGEEDIKVDPSLVGIDFSDDELELGQGDEDEDEDEEEFDEVAMG